jgi:hypothetical protein
MTFGCIFENEMYNLLPLVEDPLFLSMLLTYHCASHSTTIPSKADNETYSPLLKIMASFICQPIFVFCNTVYEPSPDRVKETLNFAVMFRITNISVPVSLDSLLPVRKHCRIIR